MLGDACGEEPLDTATSGRYARLDWPHITTDRGAGTLSVFYGSDASAGVVRPAPASRRRCCAAEPDVTPLQPVPDYQEELKHPSPMNYVPSPGSRYRNVRRLMRDQRLNIRTGGIEHLPSPLPPRHPTSRRWIRSPAS